MTSHNDINRIFTFDEERMPTGTKLLNELCFNIIEGWEEHSVNKLCPCSRVSVTQHTHQVALDCVLVAPGTCQATCEIQLIALYT